MTSRRLLWGMMLIFALACQAEEFQRKPADLTELSLEELLDIQVTSVSKRPEQLNSAPAAIYVLSQDDIRRSGANSVPEALRNVPGLNFARANKQQWAISARGFNDLFATKLLVLIDGRSVYSPAFSGIFWDMQDTMLEDIERIEVIRGPGATLWGANAVNGVINIITKSAKDTVGGLAVAGAGTEDHGFGAVRYGWQTSKNTWVRVYAKFNNEDDGALPGGDSGSDENRSGAAGFRMQWDASKDDSVNFQGDFSRREGHQAVQTASLAPPFNFFENSDERKGGENLLARWTHTFGDTSAFSLQGYVDHTWLRTTVFAEDRITVDLEFQHNLVPLEGHQIVYGVNFRASPDNIRDRPVVSADPDERVPQLYSGFAQDEIEILKDTLSATVGSKFEYNTYTGFEYQPSVRFTYTPTKKQTVWSAISRSVRTPSRLENDANVRFNAVPPGTLGPGTPAAFVTGLGSTDIDAETQISYELGYRIEPHARIKFDLAAFFNDYDNLRIFNQRSVVPEASPAPPHLRVNNVIDNKLRGAAYGAELLITARPTDGWTVQASYSNLQMDLDLRAGSTNFNALDQERFSPRHQAFLKSSFNLPCNIELDATLRYTGRLETLRIPAYLEGDLRIGWSPTRNFNLSLFGQNLFDNQHPEFRPTGIVTEPTEVERSVYLKATLKF